MSYDLSDEEREGVYATSDEKRYGYFINQAVAWGEVWTLAMGDNWVSVTAGDERYLPVWPHPGFAEESIAGDWAEYQPKAIEVHKFLDVLENLHEKGDGIALFRRADGDFISVPAAPVIEDLMAALSEIE